MPDKVLTEVKLGELTLKNPILTASGTFGYGREYAPYMDLNELGGLVTKGISLKPRLGNPAARICETAAGMMNAIGLANVGLDEFLAQKLPYLASLDTVVVVNLYAESQDDFARLAAALDGKEGVSALELNVSCPNVKEGGQAFGVCPEAVGGITRAARQETGLPLWVKLTPNVTSPVPIAQAAAAAGADAISLINTLMALSIDARKRKPRLANVYGGLSGPAIKPVGLRMVHQVSRAVELPVIGLGGIASGEDAAEYMLAGASAVQVGTANFTDPAAAVRIARELEQFCREESIERVSSLTGALEV